MIAPWAKFVKFRTVWIKYSRCVNRWDKNWINNCVALSSQRILYNVRDMLCLRHGVKALSEKHVSGVQRLQNHLRRGFQQHCYITGMRLIPRTRRMSFSIKIADVIATFDEKYHRNVAFLKSQTRTNRFPTPWKSWWRTGSIVSRMVSVL